MVGFRAAGWTCFAAALLSFLISIVGLRGIGVVGQRKDQKLPENVIDLSVSPQDSKTVGKPRNNSITSV